MRFGVIAEDMTDCNAIAVLIRRVAERCGARPPGISKRGEKGCARIPRKAGPHLRAFAAEHCTAAIVVRDLDRNHKTNTLNDIAVLRTELATIEMPSGLAGLFCIPVEELEAWFWCDQAVLNKVAGRGRKATAHAEPHRIASPKEALEKLSRAENRRPRYSTNDNAELARLLDIDLCANRCQAFAELKRFVESLLPADATHKTT